MQIRDGLHIFGEAPASGTPHRAPARHCAECARPRCRRGVAASARWLTISPSASTRCPAPLGEPWRGPRPKALDQRRHAWRSTGDTVERLETLAANLIAGTYRLPGEWAASAAVLRAVEGDHRPGAGCERGGRDGRPARRSRRMLYRTRRCRRAHARPARRAAHGPELLLGRHAPGAHRRGLAARLGLGAAPGGALRADPRRLAARVGAQRLGHVKHADGRGRYRPGARAHRRAAQRWEGPSGPRHRLRDHAARTCSTGRAST